MCPCVHVSAYAGRMMHVQGQTRASCRECPPPTTLQPHLQLHMSLQRRLHLALMPGVTCC